MARSATICFIHWGISSPLAIGSPMFSMLVFFFFNDTATTEIYTLSYTLSLHDALPICLNSSHIQKSRMPSSACDWSSDRSEEQTSELQSHSEISYAVFCLKKKKKQKQKTNITYRKKKKKKKYKKKK